MWQKITLAFLAGGVAVGTAVYFGMNSRQERPPEPAPYTAAAPPVAAQPPVSQPQPAESAVPVEPALPAATPASRPRPSAHPAVSMPARKAQPQPKPAVTAQAKPQEDVIVVPPPVPAPPPEIRPAPSPTPPAGQPEPPNPEPQAEPAAAKPVPKREPRTVTIPAGTLITVRLRDTLSSARQSTDDSFVATLDAPLIVEGLVIAERGATVRGRIVEAVEAGRVKGRAALVLQLTELNTSDGQKVEIRTDSFRHEAESGVKGDVAKAGVAAGIGAAIGAIAGGGRGAAIGAVIGGAAGAGGAMATRGKPAELPSETRLTFRLSEPVTLTERLP